MSSVTRADGCRSSAYLHVRSTCFNNVEYECPKGMLAYPFDDARLDRRPDVMAQESLSPEWELPLAHRTGEDPVRKLTETRRSAPSTKSPKAGPPRFTFGSEVMNLVVSGILNKQIAAELVASEATVKMHRSQVMKKMQAESLPELVRMAHKFKSITWATWRESMFSAQDYRW